MRKDPNNSVYSNLPKLKAVDPSRIDTLRFKYYQALAEGWEQRVETADRQGRAEDIVTLANARVEATSSGNILALLVWDEQPTGEGPGGTSDFKLRVRQLGGHREIINPTTLAG